MQIKTEAMPKLVKYVVFLDEKEVAEKKDKIYKQRKPSIELPGFRKGNVPQDIAEDRIGVEKLYTPIINEVFAEVCETEPIISSRNFKYFGDFKKGSFTMEFVAELKPTVNLVSLDKIKKEINIESPEFTEEDLKGRIKNEIESLSKIEDSTKDTLKNLDIAIIDFEGKIVGEDKPFKGGTSKGYQIRVNEIVNGRKQFIGNFEDQLVGMKLKETKTIRVKFPDDYQSETLKGKDAEFIVTLNAIKEKKIPEYNEDFVKQKGYTSIAEFEEFLKKDEAELKLKRVTEKNKKLIVSEIVKQSEISPIPEEMIDRENQKEWENFLRRMGRTEEQFIKENKISKEHFFDNNTPRVIEVIKATLVIQQIATENNITATEEEVCQYVVRVSRILDYNEEKKQKILTDLRENKRQFQLMQNSTVNEKTINFVYEKLSK